MNRQGNKDKPRGGIEWTHILGPLTGYTANPVRGCKHGCQWEMPDGAMAQCYAKSIAERLATSAYPNGFEHISYHPEELAAIRNLKEPAGIFIDSMSDLFGQDVKREWIDATIETMRACPQHVFFSLTKNPSRFREFTATNIAWPSNWLVGISAPPTIMFGKRLSLQQQCAWLHRGLEFLCASRAVNRWISIEPLSFDVGPVIAPFADRLQWAVIGAATNGAKTYQPTLLQLHSAQRSLTCPVFFKGNLSRAVASMARVNGGKWREEFPVM